MIGAARIDHLVVAADSLAQGAEWCDRVLGVVPGPDGEHPLMGTHNRLLRVATVDHPRTYFEIIARAPHPLGGAGVRCRAGGSPVARPGHRARRCGEGIAHDAARPAPVAHHRAPRSPAPGCLPTLIQWGDHHPAAAMPDSGVTFHGLAISHPKAALLREALEAIGVEGVEASEGPANLSTLLRTPAGAVRLESGGW